MSSSKWRRIHSAPRLFVAALFRRGKPSESTMSATALLRQLIPGLSRRMSADRLRSPAPVPSFGIFRILICRVTHSLGNTLLVTPLVRELEATYPGAEIDIVTRSEVATDIFGA